jgi:5-methylcytosine-specific restriction endonuclease McrA
MSRVEALSRKFPYLKDENGVRVCARCRGALPHQSRKYCSDTCRELCQIEANPHVFVLSVFKHLGTRCELCHRQVVEIDAKTGQILWWKSKAEIHHITPISEGGDNNLDNLMILCHSGHVHIHRLRRFHQTIWDTLADPKVWPPRELAQGRLEFDD